MIRITYVKDGRRKTVTAEGSTTHDAVRWMARNEPGTMIFRASVSTRWRSLPRTRATVAADETGTGAHPMIRRP